MTSYDSLCSTCDHVIPDDREACAEHPQAGVYLVQSESPHAWNCFCDKCAPSPPPRAPAPEVVWLLVGPDGGALPSWLPSEDRAKSVGAEGYEPVRYVRAPR